ncbi:hypothetical protein D1007_56498 [Hordeum vulgare]|nr:hypothetical protein D1007_56498 [Hordeum vulgare]
MYQTPSFVHYELGLPGCSLFAFDGESPRVATAPALSNDVVISMQEQKITPQVLLEGLRIWAIDGWDWQMYQISDFEFSVEFPSSKSLRIIASCTSFTLPLNQLVISVKAVMNGFKSVGRLSEVWVLVEVVPGREVQNVLKQNASKDDVQQVKVVQATTTNEKSAPVGTSISGIFSNTPVRSVSPSKSGIEDLVVSLARDVFPPVSRKKKSTIRKFLVKSRAASGSKTSVA